MAPRKKKYQKDVTKQPRRKRRSKAVEADTRKKPDPENTWVVVHLPQGVYKVYGTTWKACLDQAVLHKPLMIVDMQGVVWKPLGKDSLKAVRRKDGLSEKEKNAERIEPIQTQPQE